MSSTWALGHVSLGRLSFHFSIRNSSFVLFLNYAFIITWNTPLEAYQSRGARITCWRTRHSHFISRFGALFARKTFITLLLLTISWRAGSQNASRGVPNEISRRLQQISPDNIKVKSKEKERKRVVTSSYFTLLSTFHVTEIRRDLIEQKIARPTCSKVMRKQWYVCIMWLQRVYLKEKDIMIKITCSEMEKQTF